MIGVNSGVEGVGRKNYMIGYSAGRSANGNVNLYLGRNAGRNHIGDSCVFIGDGVGYLHNGSNRILIDVMYRTDGTYMIDLQGAQNKRIATLHAHQIIGKADTFFIKNKTGDFNKLKIFLRSDTSFLTSDYPIKLEGVPLALDSEFIQGGLRSFSKVKTLADDSEILFESGIIGWGFVQAGDNEEFSQFRFSSDGTVHLFNNTANVSGADTDAKLCLYDTGVGFAIKNRLGASKKLRYSIHFSN